MSKLYPKESENGVKLELSEYSTPAKDEIPKTLIELIICLYLCFFNSLTFLKNW